MSWLDLEKYNVDTCGTFGRSFNNADIVQDILFHVLSGISVSLRREIETNKNNDFLDHLKSSSREWPHYKDGQATPRLKVDDQMKVYKSFLSVAYVRDWTHLTSAIVRKAQPTHASADWLLLHTFNSGAEWTTTKRGRACHSMLLWNGVMIAADLWLIAAEKEKTQWLHHKLTSVREGSTSCTSI